jgi:hypothetical protein
MKRPNVRRCRGARLPRIAILSIVFAWILAGASLASGPSELSTVSVRASISKNVLGPGETVEYRLTIRNNGTAPIRDIRIVDRGLATAMRDHELYPTGVQTVGLRLGTGDRKGFELRASELDPQQTLEAVVQLELRVGLPITLTSEAELIPWDTVPAPRRTPHEMPRKSSGS